MAKWKLTTITILFLITINLALACKQVYNPAEDIIILDTIEKSGLNADCNITIYKNTSLVKTDWMTKKDLIYTYNAGKLKPGVYTAGILCNNTPTQFLGECKFKVEQEDKMIIAAIIILPMILGIIFLVGGATLDPKDHAALKIFLFLLSSFTFILSLHLGMVSVIKFYDFPALEDTIGTATYWFGIVIGIIITYFLIYLIYTSFNKMAQQKQDELKY